METVKRINEKYLVRLSFVYLLILAGFVLVLSKAFYLQVIKGRKYAELARKQYSREVTLIPARGLLLDRDGRVLAQSVLVNSFYVDPMLVKNKSRTAIIVGRTLDIDPDEVLQKLTTGKRFVWIKRLVDPETAQKLLQYHLKGIYALKEYRRFYPNRDLASSVLGFVGIDSRGLAGLELAFDRYLRGTPFSAVIDVDGHNSPIYTEDIANDASLTGDSIVTTIDLNIQFILQEAIKKAVAEQGAKAGIGIIMDPETGDILAMANTPDFNPNIYTEYPMTLFKNPAVENTYEPGSIFKPFVISSALDAGVISPDQKIFCEDGHYRVYNIVIKDAEGDFNMLSVGDILKYSSNIGAAKIGEKMGSTTLYDYLTRFGFGKQTGIALPGESPGILNPVDKWSGVSIDTIPFGQGVSATPIQLVTAMSAIANGGFLLMPQIVKAIRKPDGETETFHPVIKRRVISERAANEVTKMLIGVVNDGGTGINAAMKGYTVAGKTGTAQIPDPETGTYYRDKFISSFLGFVPANDPKIVMLIMLIEPQKNPYGGSSAAPVFKEVAERVLPYLGVPSRLNILAMPSDHPSYSEIEQAQSGSNLKTGYVPDFTGKTIRSVLELAKQTGINKLEIKGSGYAIDQIPQPYTPYSQKDTVKVWFAMSGINQAERFSKTGSSNGTTRDTANNNLKDSHKLISRIRD
ncbi:MAG: penicillin-binding protein [bacterium]